MNPIKEVTITCIFNAPPELVYKAFTNREMLMAWWGPHGFTNPDCEMDANVNGHWKINMTAPQLGFPENWCYGTFLEMIPNKKLVFATRAILHEDGSAGLEGMNTILLEEHNGKTKLTLLASLTKLDKGLEGAAAGMEQGWSESFEKLEALLSE